MSKKVVKKREMEPIPELSSQNENTLEFDDTNLFRLNLEAVKALANVFVMYQISMDFEGHELNISEELQGILFGYDPMDPSKTTLTVSPSWLESHNERMGVLVEKLNEIAIERIQRMSREQQELAETQNIPKSEMN